MDIVHPDSAGDPYQVYQEDVREIAEQHLSRFFNLSFMETVSSYPEAAAYVEALGLLALVGRNMSVTETSADVMRYEGEGAQLLVNRVISVHEYFQQAAAANEPPKEPTASREDIASELIAQALALPERTQGIFRIESEINFELDPGEGILRRSFCLTMQIWQETDPATTHKTVSNVICGKPSEKSFLIACDNGPH